MLSIELEQTASKSERRAKQNLNKKSYVFLTTVPDHTCMDMVEIELALDNSFREDIRTSDHITNSKRLLKSEVMQ
ncbi:MAG: hypothetical protein HXS54_10980 [Theionarchaea archaeon]|nr:hypothetical protein [Theionarchaea archaeon]